MPCPAAWVQTLAAYHYRVSSAATLGLCSGRQPPTVGAEINQLEGGQRLAMQLVRGLPYMGRLRQFNIFPLERRCLQAGIILAFKSFKSEADLRPSDFFLRPTRVWLRGHTYRLLQGPSRLWRRRGMYAVKYWNRLPVPLVLSPSVPTFKKKLDRQLSEILPAVPV